MMVFKYLGIGLFGICLLTACQNDDKNAAVPAPKTAEQSTSKKAEQTDNQQMVNAANADKSQVEKQSDDIEGERKLLLDQPEDERKTYYIPDSVKQSNDGLIAVVVEMTQKPIPEDNTALVRQQMIVDCQYKLSAPVAVSLFDAKGEKLEAEEFEYPDYKAFSEDELKNAQESNDEAANKLIATVCKK